MAVAALATDRTVFTTLETVAVVLQAPTLRTTTPRLLTRRGRPHYLMPGLVVVVAVGTATVRTASLAVGEALAVSMWSWKYLA